MDGISLDALGQVGASGLVVLFVILLLTGRIVPRSTLTDTQAERDSWRKAHEVSEKARAELAQSVHDLLEHARTSDAFIRSLPHQPSEPARESP